MNKGLNAALLQIKDLDIKCCITLLLTMLTVDKVGFFQRRIIFKVIIKTGQFFDTAD